ERQLGELRRLKRDGAEADPAPGAVDRLAERGDEHEHQEHAGEDQERQHEPLEPAIVDADRHPHAGGAEQRPEDLLLEEEVRIVEAIGRDDRARRIDHHHARREQDDGDAEEPDVGRELPGHLGGMGGSERRSSPIPPHRFETRGSAIRLRRRHSRRSTIFLKTSPRCSKLSNMSNEAQAGESSTMLPGVATARARSTASWSDGENVTGTDAAPSAAPIFAASSPMRTACATLRRAAAASGLKSWPLPLPPAISTIGSEKLSSAGKVESTFVPFESL